MHLMSAPETAHDDQVISVLTRHDEEAHRRLALRAVGVSAGGLAVTGAIELVLVIRRSNNFVG